MTQYTKPYTDVTLKLCVNDLLSPQHKIMINQIPLYHSIAYLKTLLLSFDLKMILNHPLNADGYSLLRLL